jgi:hypothetical protein
MGDEYVACHLTDVLQEAQILILVLKEKWLKVNRKKYTRQS